jgi:replicative DNA helicase
MMPEFDPKTAIYSPSEFATYGLEAIKNKENTAFKAIPLGIPMIEDYFAPVHPGQTVGIVGQTSHYKSGFLHYVEHQAAMELNKMGRTEECIVHISVEECVEEQAFLELSRYSGESMGGLARGDVQDWNKLEAASYKVSNIPIYRIGDSLARSEDIPNLYLTNIIKSLRHVVKEMNLKIAMIALDYLQALPIDPEMKGFDVEAQRRLQVRSDAYRLRSIASQFHCPVWVAVQAKQKLNMVNDRGVSPLIPSMYDAEESSSIAQRFDRLIGLWFPARSYPIGTKVRMGSWEYIVDEDTLMVKINKQRGGLPAGRTYECKIDFSNNMIVPKDYK